MTTSFDQWFMDVGVGEILLSIYSGNIRDKKITCQWKDYHIDCASG